MENSLIKLHGDGVAKIFPDGIVVYNFDDDDDGKLSQIISSNPGKPVVFLSTKFNRNVFSQAEGHNRAFIFLRDAIDPAGVDPEYPAQWVSDGDCLPGLPGNLNVTATAGGFLVETLSPSTPQQVIFRYHQ